MHTILRMSRGHGPEVVDVRPVHAEDQVETLEVVAQHLSRLLPGNVDVVARRDGDRPWVWRRSLVPAASAG